MIDYIEDYYNAVQDDNSAQAAQRKAFSLILPFIMKQELTERQYICIKYKYESGKSQDEIAKSLKLSQPTVSRHINTAKKVINNNLKYCYAAVNAAISEYDKMERAAG